MLINSNLSLELIRLCEFSPNDNWSLLYRATRDGFGSNDFHSNCDDHSNTLDNFIEGKGCEFIFCGLTTVTCDYIKSCKSGVAKSCKMENAMLSLSRRTLVIYSLLVVCRELF